jgi:hypothetical protein
MKTHYSTLDSCELATFFFEQDPHMDSPEAIGVKVYQLPFVHDLGSKYTSEL